MENKKNDVEKGINVCVGGTAEDTLNNAIALVDGLFDNVTLNENIGLYWQIRHIHSTLQTALEQHAVESRH